MGYCEKTQWGCYKNRPIWSFREYPSVFMRGSLRYPTKDFSSILRGFASKNCYSSNIQNSPLVRTWIGITFQEKNWTLKKYSGREFRLLERVEIWESFKMFLLFLIRNFFSKKLKEILYVWTWFWFIHPLWEFFQFWAFVTPFLFYGNVFVFV